MAWAHHNKWSGGRFVVVALLLAMAAVACGGSTAEAGEVYLEAKIDTGPDPFIAEVRLPEVPELPALELATQPTPTPEEPEEPAEVVTVSAVSGADPGLYGGSQDQAVCDVAQLVAFLEDNQDKASAWASVLDIEPSDIGAYAAALTPVILRADTRVTNHGFRDGKPTERQSVLEAGTAVLVDETGVPRVRCACGNPLLEPEAAPGRVAFQGEPWDDFDPGLLAAVTPAEPQAKFTLLAAGTETTFTRPAGTTGAADIQVLPEVIEATPTPSPTPSPVPEEAEAPTPTLPAFEIPTPTSTPTVTVGPGTPTPTPDTPTPSPTRRPTPRPSRAPTPTVTVGPRTPTPTPRPPTPTPTTQPPTPTPTPTTPVTLPPTAPELFGGGAGRDVYDESCAENFPESGYLSYAVSASYSDINGDAQGTVLGNFGSGNENINGFTSFSGDGFRGSFTSHVCVSPGGSVTLTLRDQGGNSSNSVTVGV